MRGFRCARASVNALCAKLFDFPVLENGSLRGRSTNQVLAGVALRQLQKWSVFHGYIHRFRHFLGIGTDIKLYRSNYTILNIESYIK